MQQGAIVGIRGQPSIVSGTDNELYESVKEEQDDASSIHLSDWDIKLTSLSEMGSVNDIGNDSDAFAWYDYIQQGMSLMESQMTWEAMPRKTGWKKTSRGNCHYLYFEILRRMTQ